MHLDRNGYYDLPPGKIASLVTYLEMTEPPAPRREADARGLALRRADLPDLDWYRDLFRRIGTDWLWFGRLVMPDDEVRAVIGDRAVEIYALTSDGRDEGLLELRRRRGITVAGTPERGAVMQKVRELVEFARGQGYAVDELVQMIEDVG